MIGDIDDVVAKMREISLLGVHFSIDDFGTGFFYSLAPVTHQGYLYGRPVPADDWIEHW